RVLATTTLRNEVTVSVVATEKRVEGIAKLFFADRASTRFKRGRDAARQERRKEFLHLITSIVQDPVDPEVEVREIKVEDLVPEQLDEPGSAHSNSWAE